jgi:DNA-binding GntR family transcriptional regulator
MRSLEAPRSHSLAITAKEEIESMILDGDLKAGERINEIQLAARLSMSRGPVREACHALEQIGLVTSITNRGHFVRKISLKEALDAYDLRAVLFGLAGQTLVHNLEQRQIRTLKQLLQNMDDARDRDDAKIYYPLNLRFHKHLIEFSGNGQLVSIYLELVKKLHLFRRRTLVSAAALKASSQEHRAILRAIVRRDASETRRLMEQHVLAGKARFLARLQHEKPEC